MFANGLNLDFPLQASIKDTVYGVKIKWLSDK